MSKTRVAEVADIERVYREQGRKLWWALLAYSGDPDIASDALADAFARALSQPGSIKDASAWVWRVAFRVAATELKGRSTGEPIDSSYEIDDRVGEVLDGLRRLSPNQCAAIVLFYYADRTTKEIASTLGMSVATVSVHLHRGRNHLRSLLGDQDE